MGLVLGEYGLRPRESVARCHHRTHDGGPVVWVEGVHSPSPLPEGDRRVDGDVHGVCVHRHGGICLRQLTLEGVAETEKEAT